MNCTNPKSNRVSGCISVAGNGGGGVVVTRSMVRIAGFAAREKGAGEGIGSFAAKRDDVPDGCARGIEAEMFLA